MKKEYQDKLVKIGKEIAEVLKDLKEVRAIAFLGAIGRCYADKYSDIDIVCYCNKTPNYKRRWLLLAQLGIKSSKIPGSMKGFFDIFDYKNKQVSLCYKEIKPIDKKIKDSLKLGKLSQDLIEMLNTRECFDHQNIIKGWKEKLSKLRRPSKKAWEEKIKWIFMPLRHFIMRDWIRHVEMEPTLERKNWIYLNQWFASTIEQYLGCLYALNREYYFNSKWSFKEIKKFKLKPRNCIRRLERLSRIGNKPEEFHKKLRIMHSLVKEIYPFIKKEYLKLDFAI